jgi:hypothetical protein
MAAETTKRSLLSVAVIALSFETVVVATAVILLFRSGGPQPGSETQQDEIGAIYQAAHWGQES